MLDAFLPFAAKLKGLVSLVGMHLVSFLADDIRP
jgi:hypothetical protein